MDNKSATANVEIVYEEDLEMLDEAKHYNSQDLLREINRLRKEINRLRK